MNYPSFDGTQLCAQTDPEIFFPEKGQPGKEAKAICVQCHFKKECREYSLHYEMTGIWGGLNWKERRYQARKRGITQRTVSMPRDMSMTEAAIQKRAQRERDRAQGAA